MPAVELRPVNREDAELIVDIVNRSEAHDGVPRILSLEEMVEEFDDPFFDPAVDAWIAELDGAAAGYGRVWHAPNDEGDYERAYLFGDVLPEHRGQGVGRAIISRSLKRARARLRPRPAAHKFIRVSAFDFALAAVRLHRAAGFTPVRWFEELLRPLSDLPPLTVPDGVRIIPAPVERAEEIRQSKNAAFDDHWGSVPTPPELWKQVFMEGHGRRLDLSFVAVDAATDQIVAHCLNAHYPQDAALHGRLEGLVDSLGTRREYRGRGLATALINHSLHAFAAEGMTHALIEVDADSPTGASRLYRSLGFELLHRSVTAQIDVSSERDPTPDVGDAPTDGDVASGTGVSGRADAPDE